MLACDLWTGLQVLRPKVTSSTALSLDDLYLIQDHYRILIFTFLAFSASREAQRLIYCIGARIMSLLQVILVTSFLHAVSVFPGPTLASTSSTSASTMVSGLSRHRSTSASCESLRHSVATDGGRHKTKYGNSAPSSSPLSSWEYSSTIAHENFPLPTSGAKTSLCPTGTDAIVKDLASSYYVSAQTVALHGTGLLPGSAPNIAPFSFPNSSSNTLLGYTSAGTTFASGALLQMTAATGASNSLIVGLPTRATSVAYNSMSSRVDVTPSSTLIGFEDDDDNGNDYVAVSSTPVPASTSVTSPEPRHSSAGSTENPSIWNMKNVDCDGFSYTMNGSQQWTLVDGDQVVSTFESMFASNALICTDCWGQTNATCTSSDWRCQYGLRDLSHANGNASRPARWDTAAARFARQGSETDLVCDIMQTECSAAPDCKACDGPGPWAIIKSLQTMQNLMKNIHDAIIQAGVACNFQMDRFTKTFAPIPPLDLLTMELSADIFGGIMGCVPILGAIGSIATSVGSTVGLSKKLDLAPDSPDSSSVLGMVANKTAQVYADFAAELFETGSASLTSDDGKINNKVDLRDQMKDGALMIQQEDRSGYYDSLVPVYQRIMFQQLALYTWQNLITEDSAHFGVVGSQHIAFITFDNTPCEHLGFKADPNNNKGTPGTTSSIFPDLLLRDVHITYEGRCYYLVDASVFAEQNNNGQASGPTGTNRCGSGAFPGGTNKELRENSDEFASLSLADFIIPAVRGWQANGKMNGFPTAVSNGRLPEDPQAAASVSIMVCDYANSPDRPGAGCPKIGDKVIGNRCATYPTTNQPGSYHPGNCRVHVTQYKPKEVDNPLADYELAITVFDDANIEIGQGTKQSAHNPLVIVDSTLPFQLTVATGADKDTIAFWYADQYWDSKTGCGTMGRYDRGSRQGDCTFSCPFSAPGDPKPVTATQAHPFPGPTVAAIAGSATFRNTFITEVSTATPAPPAATYAKGKCAIVITQYQKHENGENETGDYEIDATIYDSKDSPVANSGKIPAPGGKAIDILGLVDTVTLTAGAVDADPFTVNYQGDTWKTSDKGKCKVDGYAAGKRRLNCPLIC